jgi:adenylosuccinate lyase
MWEYISRDVFVQEIVDLEIGSSAMPHKVNPIKFENAEANLELAVAMFDVLSSSLSTTRMQRDLTDSALQRNVGSAFAFSVLAMKNILSGFKRVKPNKTDILQEIDNNWELLAEAITNALRLEIAKGNSDEIEPYEKLKTLTRGNEVTKQDIHNFIRTLSISEEVKERLLALEPSNYTGIASKLAVSPINGHNKKGL